MALTNDEKEAMEAFGQVVGDIAQMKARMSFLEGYIVSKCEMTYEEVKAMGPQLRTDD